MRLLVLLVAFAIALAACGGGSSSTAAPGATTPGGSEATTPSGDEATEAPEATEGSGETGVSGDPWLAAWKWDQLNWYSFKNFDGKVVKLEYSPATKDGADVVKLVTTIDGEKLQESYYDKTTRAFISGTVFGVVDTPMSEGDVDGLSWDASRTFDPGELGSDATKTSDTITNAKGTFQCTKYDTAAAAEYWVCDGAPLPLRFHTSVTDVTWEPLDWG
jgi:hypothetical protein